MLFAICASLSDLSPFKLPSFEVDVLFSDGSASALGIDIVTGGGTSSSASSVQEQRRPVTAQERQREREEKRRKRQERARERERKLKEKEKREGKQGDSLGGVLLSDNDKSLLQRWTKMMDSCNEKSHPGNNDRSKNRDCKMNLNTGAVTSDNSNGGLNNNTDQETRKIQSHEQLIPQIKTNQPGLFQPSTTQQPSLPFSMSQQKPSSDIVLATGGNIDMTVTGGCIKNNTLKPHTERNGQSGFSCLGNWSGQQLETRPPQPPNRTSQPLQSSFLQHKLQPRGQTQSDSHPQSQLLSLEGFLVKAPALSIRETNGNLNVGGQNNLNTLTAGTEQMEKLCPVGEKTATQTTTSICGTLGVSSQPHPSLGFTDTGQQGASIAPDIHTVTLQLSKSQVCTIICCWFSHAYVVLSFLSENII